MGQWATVIAAFVRAFAKGLLRYAGPLVAKVLVFFGLTVVSYHLGVEPLKDIVISQLSGLPAVAWQVIGLTRADKAITVIFSALSVRGASRLVMRRAVRTS